MNEPRDRSESTGEGGGVGNSTTAKIRTTLPTAFCKLKAIEASRLPKKGVSPFLDLPPLGRKIIERNFAPFPVPPNGGQRNGRDAPTPPKASDSPGKRVFKAPC